MTRTFGSLALKGSTWLIDAEPHVVIRLKRVFGRVHRGAVGKIKLASSDETCRELEWFMDRYPLAMSADDRAALEGSAAGYREKMLLLEQIIDPDYVPRPVDLAIPARDYQRAAAEALHARGFLLLGDDVGLGKTVSAICALRHPEAMPAVVVTLSGVMPKQWQAEIERFIPGTMVHVLKKGTPYELPKFMGRGPDVLVLNYHKLAGWADVLRKYARTVVFDEIQELRRSQSAKYAGAVALAAQMRFRMGLSATPIFNYGGEIYNVLNVLQPGVLGKKGEFDSQWCSGWSAQGDAKIKNPGAFGIYMREQCIMLAAQRETDPQRRQHQQVAKEVGETREKLDASGGARLVDGHQRRGEEGGQRGRDDPRAGARSGTHRQGRHASLRPGRERCAGTPLAWTRHRRAVPHAEVRRDRTRRRRGRSRSRRPRDSRPRARAVSRADRSHRKGMQAARGGRGRACAVARASGRARRRRRHGARP